MSVMDDRDAVLECPECDATLTRHDYREQLREYAPKLLKVGLIPDLDKPACPGCGSENVWDHRTPEDREFEREVFSA